LTVISTLLVFLEASRGSPGSTLVRDASFLSGSCSGELGLRSFIDDARRGKIQKTYMPIQRIKALERLDMTTRGAMISLEEAAR
jgi:hypothetical protein